MPNEKASKCSNHLFEFRLPHNHLPILIVLAVQLKLVLQIKNLSCREFQISGTIIFKVVDFFPY